MEDDDFFYEDLYQDLYFEDEYPEDDEDYPYGPQEEE